MIKSRSTINDVARLARVSKSTVSHVVNRTRFVEDATQKRVLAAIYDLGYVPSTAAQSLTTKRSRAIGVIVSDTSNYFFGEILRGIESVFTPLNYGLIVCNTDEVLEREEKSLDLLLRQRVDGIIATATSQQWAPLKRASLENIPIVFVDRVFEGIDDMPVVGVDNFDGAYQGTQHIIANGHRKIGVLAGFQRLSTMRERLAGFRQALNDDGQVVNESWVAFSLLGVEEGRSAAKTLLSLPDRPSALFVNNNLLTLGVLLALKDLNLRCPQDVAVVGFDDHPWAQITDPPLTVVRQPVTRLGKQAATMMLDLLQGGDLKRQSSLLKCELVVRESCIPVHSVQLAKHSTVIKGLKDNQNLGSEDENS